MPPLICPKCRRANPETASFCCMDGVPLRQSAAAKAHGQLAHEFVFPSGRNARSYDDLVRCCQEEWEEARNLLRQGVFASFFASSGRMDLVQAAQKAQHTEDPDVGLHNFLSALPASKVAGPKLELKPRRIAMGALRAGEIKPVTLVVSNSGKGLLHGTVSVAAGEEWLRIDMGQGPVQQGPLKVAQDQKITVIADTKNQSAKQSYAGKLTFITNGGVVEVPVTMDVAALPFPKAPFQGASSPREMAERMRQQPKQAVPLLESGEIARWFTANGWIYPVPLSAARGVAAVQQFFEGMGLAKPPPLQLTETEARFICMHPEVAQGQVTLKTPVKKWVYGSVESDAPWLRVTTPTISGPQQAIIAYEVDSSLMDEGQQVGEVQVIANAGQKLTLKVFVDVRKPHVPFTRRLLRPFFAGAILFLLFRLLLAGPFDLFARVLMAPESEGIPRGSFQAWLHGPQDTSYVRWFTLATWWVGAIAGAVMAWNRGGKIGDILCGIVAGAAGGLMATATFACLMPLLDFGPWLIWCVLSFGVGKGNLADAAYVWTPLWIILAVVCWTVMGALIGFVLRLAGQRGLQLLAWLASPITGVANALGMRGVAAFFAMQ